jgi:hypothetical protein
VTPPIAVESHVTVVPAISGEGTLGLSVSDVTTGWTAGDVVAEISTDGLLMTRAASYARTAK